MLKTNEKLIMLPSVFLQVGGLCMEPVSLGSDIFLIICLVLWQRGCLGLAAECVDRGGGSGNGVGTRSNWWLIVNQPSWSLMSP